MLLKLLSFVLLLEIIAINGDQTTYMIKNKKTGMVLDAPNRNSKVFMAQWKQRKCQLWTKEPSDKDGFYYFKNVATGNVLDACPNTKAVLSWAKHGANNQKWSLHEDGDERLIVAHYPNDNLMHKGGKVMLDTSQQNDESDQWLLVEPEAV